MLCNVVLARYQSITGVVPICHATSMFAGAYTARNTVLLSFTLEPEV